MKRNLFLLISFVLAFSTFGFAETVVLKDGSFVEGKIVLQTSTTLRLKTRFGSRTFAKKDVDKILESMDTAGAGDPKHFAELPAVNKAVLNAEADYELKNYEHALARLEPLRDYQENKVLRMKIDWLIIEINERLGRWDEAKKLLKDKQDHGTPPEKVRAKAHFDIFELNPEYDLRFVGKKSARNFVYNADLRNKAKEPGALKDADIMRLALEEYCEQLLVEDKQSVRAFGDKLDVKATYDVIKKSTATGDLTKTLPYMKELKAAEASILKAQSVLGDYGTAFELDLVRTELNHLTAVATMLERDVAQVDPDTFTPPSDPASGALTADGRRQWQQRCDDFLAAIRPLTRIVEYAISRAEPYPRELRDIREASMIQFERINQYVKAVKKARERTHV
ncbi:MAG: hypothetical protein HY287_12570 [Planctomycetes bacterium]|nr:hypothetical protein [Planctomycetota bacterium]